jgi:hypothetical protein
LKNDLGLNDYNNNDSDLLSFNNNYLCKDKITMEKMHKTMKTSETSSDISSSESFQLEFEVINKQFLTYFRMI